MSDRSDRLATIERGGVIAILRGIDAADVEAAGVALADGGITAVEVTAETSGVTDRVDALREGLADRDALVGVGTVLDAETANAVVDAGAQFLVSPALRPEVIRTANRRDVAVLPGVMTPTEAVCAHETGADAVKLFPARSVGPGHVSALRAPLPDIDVVPTGGVTLETAGAYIEAGALAVGVGSALFTEEIATSADWAALERRAAEFRAAVDAARE